jgi:UDP-N-acetylmuramyl pentapeptide phosphotransferase/UDP-N-acetylglucosamine-1-phosphate transferase
MIALKVFGIVCLVFFCFAIPVTLTVDALQKPKPTRIGKDGKRELKINRISYWDYLIIFLPACLLLIGLLSNDREEKLTSLMMLGGGYAYMLVSPYNNRIDIPWIRKTVLITSIILAITGYLLSLTNYNYELHIGLNTSITLFYPLITYIYLVVMRNLIKLFTNTYPITVDKHFNVGHFSRRYNRRATYLDLLWTMWNMIGFPILVGTILR